MRCRAFGSVAPTVGSVAFALVLGVSSAASAATVASPLPSPRQQQALAMPPAAAVLAAGQSVVTGGAAAASDVHFPDLATVSLSLEKPLVRPVVLPELPAAQEQALVPIPPAAWPGLALLGALGLTGCRRAILRFVM